MEYSVRVPPANATGIHFDIDSGILISLFAMIVHFFRFGPRLRLRALTIRGQCQVGETAAHDASDGFQEATLIVVFAFVEPEGLFVQIAEKVFRVHADIGAFQSPFEKCPEVFETVGMNVAPDVFHGVVNGGVDVCLFHRAVSGEAISEHVGTGFYLVHDFTVQHGALCGLDDLGMDAGRLLALATFQQTENNLLADAAPALDALRALVGVHVGSLAADVSLVGLDGATHLHNGAALQSEADTLQHEPPGFLSDAQRTANLTGRNAVLGIGDQPDGRPPFTELDRAVFKDGAHLYRELLLLNALPAFPDLAGGDEADPLRTAPRAGNNAVRPAERNHKSEGVFFDGEEAKCLSESFRERRINLHAHTLHEL